MLPGGTVDTKNALRTFLTSSSDFSHGSGAGRPRENMVQMARHNLPRDVEMTATRDSVLLVPSSTAPARRPRDVSDRDVWSALKAEPVSASLCLPKAHVTTTASHQKSPRQAAACLPAAAVFPAITDIARFSINSTGHPPLAVPLLMAQSVDAGIRGRHIFGALAVTSVPQPSSSLSSIVLPPGFAAGPTLRLPLAPVQPVMSVVTTASALLPGDTAERTEANSQAVTASEAPAPAPAAAPHVDQLPAHQDVSSAVNWKLKMARDHVSNSKLVLGNFLFWKCSLYFNDCRACMTNKTV